MLVGDFQDHLKKVHPLARIDQEKAVNNPNGEGKIAGLYIGDVHVCSCPVPVIPDEDVKKDNVLDAQGMRTILRMLIRQGAVDQGKAEKTFRMSLGMNWVNAQSFHRFRNQLKEYQHKGFRK